MKKRFAQACQAAVLSSVAMLGSVAVVQPAEAAYVVIRADPAYGPEFAGLGWRATGALYIPDACLAVAALGSYFVNPLTVPLADISPVCGNSRLQDVKLQFYNLADEDTTVETLDIGVYAADTGTPSDADDLAQELIDYSFSRGALVGFNTTLSTPQRATDLLAGAGRNCFSLDFSSDTARLVAFDYVNGICSSTPSGESSNPATIEWAQRGFIPNASYVRAADPVVVPTAVPEPATLALTLAALAAAGAARRRPPCV